MPIRWWATEAVVQTHDLAAMTTPSNPIGRCSFSFDSGDCKQQRTEGERDVGTENRARDDCRSVKLAGWSPENRLKCLSAEMAHVFIQVRSKTPSPVDMLYVSPL